MSDRDERDEEGQSRRGFKVEDRRRFAGDAPAASTESEEPAEPPRAARAPVDEPRASTGGDATAADALAEMTFSTFVMGLTTQALMHLGEIADPAQQIVRDLPAAKQMIDLLGILREKTRGNLDAAEDQLLGSMLYDLRMRYVEVSRNQS